MSSSDIEYFRERAAVERALAKAAGNPTVAAIHDELARGYEALARPSAARSVGLDGTSPPNASLADARPIGLDGTSHPDASADQDEGFADDRQTGSG